MRKVPHNGTVLGRANDLLDAWLKGANQGGADVTPEDIKEVFLTSLARAKKEARETAKLQRAVRATLSW